MSTDKSLTLEQASRYGWFLAFTRLVTSGELEHGVNARRRERRPQSHGSTRGPIRGKVKGYSTEQRELPQDAWIDLDDYIERVRNAPVGKALMDLDDDARLIVSLRHGMVDGRDWDFPEIARVMRRHTQSVHRSYHRAMIRLRSTLPKLEARPA